MYRYLSGLLLLLLAAGCATTGVTPPPPTASPTPPQVILLTNTPAFQPVLERTNCPGAPETRLILYERGRVSDRDPDALNLRAGPGTNFSILDRMPPGVVFFVLEGPICAQSYAWYRVDFRGEEGWIAEGDRGRYYVDPYPPG